MIQSSVPLDFKIDRVLRAGNLPGTVDDRLPERAYLRGAGEYHCLSPVHLQGVRGTQSTLTHQIWDATETFKKRPWSPTSHAF